jgi:hypothetical protein
MAEDGFIMVHEPKIILFGGKSSELKKRAAVLDQLKNSIVNIYQKRTGLNASEIEKMVDDETWLNADQAKEKGFIDEITEKVQAAASSRVFSYSNLPDEIKAEFCELPEHLANDMKQNTSKNKETLKMEEAKIKADFSEMVNLFGKEKAAEYFQNGKDINAAKSEYIASLKSEIENLKAVASGKDAEIAELKNKLELAKTAVTVAPVNNGSQGQPPPAKTYEEIYAGLTTGEKKFSAREAVKFIIINHKAEYDAYMAKHQRKE